MVIISKDPQRIDHWQKAANTKADIASSVKESQDLLAGSAATCIVDLASFSNEDKAVLEQLIKSMAVVRFFIFSAVPNASEGVHWIRAGAKGYANRLMNKEVFKVALQSINRDEVWAGKIVVQYLLSGLQAAGHAGSVTGLSMLTGREREIADFVGNGLNNKEISSELKISESTVKAHLNKVFKKMDVDSRVQLALELEIAKAEKAAIHYS